MEIGVLWSQKRRCMSLYRQCQKHIYLSFLSVYRDNARNTTPILIFSYNEAVCLWCQAKFGVPWGMGPCWVHENASLQGILNHRHSFTSNIPRDVLKLSNLMLLRFLHVWVGGLWLLKLETGVLSAENAFCSLLKRGSRKFMFNCSCRHLSISSHFSRKGLSAVIITYCRASMCCSINTISYLTHSYLSPLL